MCFLTFTRCNKTFFLRGTLEVSFSGRIRSVLYFAVFTLAFCEFPHFEVRIFLPGKLDFCFSREKDRYWLRCLISSPTPKENFRAWPSISARQNGSHTGSLSFPLVIFFMDSSSFLRTLFLPFNFYLKDPLKANNSPIRGFILFFLL